MIFIRVEKLAAYALQTRTKSEAVAELRHTKQECGLQICLRRMLGPIACSRGQSKLRPIGKPFEFRSERFHRSWAILALKDFDPNDCAVPSDADIRSCSASLDDKATEVSIFLTKNAADLAPMPLSRIGFGLVCVAREVVAGLAGQDDGLTAESSLGNVFKRKLARLQRRVCKLSAADRANELGVQTDGSKGFSSLFEQSGSPIHSDQIRVL